MPFDSMPPKLPLTRTQKLERLLYHLSLATDEEQKNFCMCLAHRCIIDPVLVDDGLPKPFWPYGHWIDWSDYFEIRKGQINPAGFGRLFGAGKVADKIAWIKANMD